MRYPDELATFKHIIGTDNSVKMDVRCPIVSVDIPSRRLKFSRGLIFEETHVFS